MTRTFMRYVFYALLIETALLVASAFQFATVATPTLYVRVTLLLRWTLLAAMFIRALWPMEIDRLKGVGLFWKIPRFFRLYPALNVWFLTGVVQTYLLAAPALVTDVVLVFTGDLDRSYAALWIAMDFLFAFEFYITVHAVYFVGVVQNVRIAAWPYTHAALV